MAKFCEKCGCLLDETTGVCKNCNSMESLIKIEEKKSAKQKHNGKKTLSTKHKKKNLFLKIFAIVLALVIIAGSTTVALVYFDVVDIPFISQLIDRKKKSSAEEVYASEIVTAFKTDDIEKINDIIFSNDRVVLDENIGVSFNENTEDTSIEQKNGILSEIFSRVDISYEGIEGQQFIYIVKSPDMSGVFDNVLELQTTDELIEHICNYAQNTKTVKFDVAVDYVNNQDQIIANYQTEEFINAITGGLANEYKKIYTQYINELLADEG